LCSYQPNLFAEVLKQFMEELIPISITISDRNFRIKVSSADEESIRKTVKFINDKVLEFKGNFAGKDMQDYISMVLIWFATQPNEDVRKQIATDDLQQDLQRLESLIDKGLTAVPFH
jgi:cell division protein ZapA